MKPLLSAPLTTEDDWAWYMVMCRKNGRSFGIRSFSVQSDRRDADLMLAAQEKRVGHWGQVVHYAQVEPDRYRYTSFGGAVLGSMAIDPATWRDITYFA